MTSASDPTYLGTITSVSGSSVTVRLAESIASGLAIIGGHTYRVGQVGSFVRVPQGYQDLFGVVSEVGANSAPSSETEQSARWMRVELAGEAIGARFERGLSQHPNINDSVHLVTESDLTRIYGQPGSGEITIGHLASAENIRVKVSLDALVTRHSAILGSTGSGKSTTVASLIRSIVAPGDDGRGAPGARILLLDIHGEYRSALADLACVFSATPQPGEENLVIPFWALEAGELLEFVAGPLSENHNIAFTEKIQELKEQRLNQSPLAGLEISSLTVDSPVPFSLKKLWYDLIDFELMTFTGQQRDVPALVAPGDADGLVAPKYRPHGLGSAGPFLNTGARGIRRLACTRFRRHRVRCFNGTGGWSWRDESSRGSSSLRRCG